MKRTRLVFGSLTGAVVIHLAMVACARIEGFPDAMMHSDVGGMLDGMLDAPIRDANAQDSGSGTPPMVGMCDQVRTTTTTVAGSTTVQRYHFAEFVVPGLDPSSVPNIDALICDPMPSDQTYEVPGPTCPPGSPCVASGYSPGRPTCSPSPNVLLYPGRVVVWCGSTGGAASGTQNGIRWLRALIRVR